MCLNSSALSDFSYTAGLWAPGWQITPTDFDNDGRTDLFLYNGSVGDQNAGRWFRVFTGPDGSFTYEAGAVRWASSWRVTAGDFDGDGRSDVFLYDPASGVWFVVQFTGGGNATYTAGLWAPNWTITAADFNGDGRTDLFLST
jgi:hypothetical protein